MHRVVQPMSIAKRPDLDILGRLDKQIISKINHFEAKGVKTIFSTPEEQFTRYCEQNPSAQECKIYDV